MEEGREYIDSTIELIEEGKKYKKMWEYVKKHYGDGYYYYTEDGKDCVTFVHRMMTGVEQKYFPKPKEPKPELVELVKKIDEQVKKLLEEVTK